MDRKHNMIPYPEYMDTCISHVWRMDQKNASAYREMMSEREAANTITLYHVMNVENRAVRREYQRDRMERLEKAELRYGLSPLEACAYLDITLNGRYREYAQGLDELMHTDSLLSEDDRKFIDMAQKVTGIYEKQKENAGIRHTKPAEKETAKGPKYELTDETAEIRTEKGAVIPVRRIRALRDFGDVKAGELGGFIESEENLSHNGRCWVYGDAKAGGKTSIQDDASIRDNAVAVNVSMKGSSLISMDAQASNVVMSGKSTITDNAFVDKRYHTTGRTIMKGDSRIEGDAVVRANLRMCGDAAIVSGTYTTNMDLGADAYICDPDDYIKLPEIGACASAFRCVDGDVRIKTGTRNMEALNMGINTFYPVSVFKKQVESMCLGTSVETAANRAIAHMEDHFYELCGDGLAAAVAGIPENNSRMTR